MDRTRVRPRTHAISVVLVIVLAMSACGEDSAGVEASSGAAAARSTCASVMEAVTDGQSPAEVAEALRETPDADAGLADALLRLDAGETMTDSDREAFAPFRDECSGEFERAAALENAPRLALTRLRCSSSIDRSPPAPTGSAPSPTGCYGSTGCRENSHPTTR